MNNDPFYEFLALFTLIGVFVCGIKLTIDRYNYDKEWNDPMNVKKRYWTNRYQELYRSSDEMDYATFMKRHGCTYE